MALIPSFCFLGAIPLVTAKALRAEVISGSFQILGYPAFWLLWQMAESARIRALYAIGPLALPLGVSSGDRPFSASS